MVIKRQYETLFVLLMGTGVFNIADYFLTLHVVSQGHEEANPIINLILHTVYFPLVKLLVVPFLLMLIWRLRHHVNMKRIIPCTWLMFISYFSLMVYFKLVFL